MNQYVRGQKVQLVIIRETDLGFVAKINGVDEGLLYHNEIFELLRPNQEVPGYISKIRDNGQIDLILQPLGSNSSHDIGQQILEALKKNGGTLEINAASEAENIYNMFGVSKKKFKMALGGLYKKRLIVITDTGIELVK